MAKNKEFEILYREIGRERARLRRIIRNKQHRRNVQNRGMPCDRCGNRMSWCSICEEWSRTCCEEYGTCQCS